MSGNRTGRIGRYMDGVTERHTREIIQRQLQKKHVTENLAEEVVASNLEALQAAGVLPELYTRPVTVILPSGKQGQAIGIDDNGCVLLEGEKYPFSPKRIKEAPI